MMEYIFLGYSNVISEGVARRKFQVLMKIVQYKYFRIKIINRLFYVAFWFDTIVYKLLIDESYKSQDLHENK